MSFGLFGCHPFGSEARVVSLPCRTSRKLSWLIEALFRTEIWRTSGSYGAFCETQLSDKTTHLLAKQVSSSRPRFAWVGIPLTPRIRFLLAGGDPEGHRGFPTAVLISRAHRPPVMAARLDRSVPPTGRGRLPAYPSDLRRSATTDRRPIDHSTFATDDERHGTSTRRIGGCRGGAR